MNLTPIYANTLIPQLPKLINDNFKAVSEYINFFYDGSNNIIVKPINTTGRVKATTGEFVNILVDNLTVKKEFMNMYENITTSDIDFVTTYHGPDASVRIATDSSTIWPYESSYYKWIDVTSPYYKISNEEPLGLQSNSLGQVVRFIFNAADGIPNNFHILLDPYSNSTFEVSATDSSALYLELINVKNDASYGPTWIPYKFGRLDASFAGGGGGGSVLPGTIDYIPKYYSNSTVGNSNLFLDGATLNTNDISVGGNIKTQDIIINKTIKDLNNNTLFKYDGSILEINQPGIGRDVSIYGYTNFANNVNIDGSLYVDGSLFVGAGGGTSITEFDPTISDTIAMVEDVGGLTAGTTAGDLKGDSYDKLLSDILFPTAYPDLSDPFNTFSLVFGFSTLQEIGDDQNIQFVATFDRGEIDPAYGTSGFRSGLANTYTYTGTGIDGSVASTSNTDYVSALSYTILTGYQSWTNTVSYDEGEQPLDNKGNPYDSPWPAGTTSAKTITIEGVYPLFGTTSTISNPDTKQPLISMITGNNIVLTMANQPVGSSNTKSFDISNEWITSRPITNIQVYSTLSGQWENPGMSKWTTSSTTQTIEGNDVNYTRYSWNGGDQGEFDIKIIF